MTTHYIVRWRIGNPANYSVRVCSHKHRSQRAALRCARRVMSIISHYPEGLRYPESLEVVRIAGYDTARVW